MFRHYKAMHLGKAWGPLKKEVYAHHHVDKPMTREQHKDLKDKLGKFEAHSKSLITNANERELQEINKHLFYIDEGRKHLEGTKLKD
jgi:hypothetical protein